jgi:hypothetical protein
MYRSFLKPDIVIGTRLPLFHLFATRTLWVRIELVARDNAAEQKVMSIRWP